ncbi:MAG TPA: alpha/beta hydrolase [Polyangiaceae bacterium]|nr:alpha/beta hydrolase [Polyangiaceae bacterium]
MDKSLTTLVFGLSIGIMGGCGSSTPGMPSSAGTGGFAVGTGGRASGAGGSATGGSGSAGSASGGNANGGAATGGSASGGTASGGSASGGTSSAGGSGGAAAGGHPGSGGAASGGSAGTGGGSSNGAPAPSKGCTVPDGLKTLTSGGMSVANGLPTSTRLKITSGGSSREYIIDIPADYNPTHPYRLIFSWHQAYGSDTGNAIGQYPAGNGPNFDAKNYAYFGLHREATAAKDPAIFIAPGGIGNLPWDFTRDSALFDDLLALVDANLCIDDSRVFTTGFSFGAMMSYSLSITRQKKLRAAVTMAAANYNLPGQPSDSNAAPIAYMGITGMSDGTCPWVSNDASKQGGKYCVLTHAQDNGCTIPGTIQTTTVGSKKYLCYDFEGCKAGYPVKVCTFDGPHTPSAVDDGSSTGDDGLKAFVPPLAWKFISQF